MNSIGDRTNFRLLYTDSTDDFIKEIHMFNEITRIENRTAYYAELVRARVLKKEKRKYWFGYKNVVVFEKVSKAEDGILNKMINMLDSRLETSVSIRKKLKEELKN